jgi:hypothetical protein
VIVAMESSPFVLFSDSESVIDLEAPGRSNLECLHILFILRCEIKSQ